MDNDKFYSNIGDMYFITMFEHNDRLMNIAETYFHPQKITRFNDLKNRPLTEIFGESDEAYNARKEFEGEMRQAFGVEFAR